MKLNKFCRISGSRGGILIYNWAAENPGRVACVYADNVLLDLNYWPDSATLKQDFHLKNIKEIQGLKLSPVDKIPQIVKVGYSMLHLLADADGAVDTVKNTLRFETDVKALGGEITVIHKPGFKHHPHSQPNPSPIVDFILKVTGLGALVSKAQ
jgi:hypothetical protein